MLIRTLLLVAALIPATLLPATGSARAATFVAEYEGEAYGIITLGKARLAADISNDRYDAEGFMQTVGLAALFGRALITAHADGRLHDGRATAHHYALDHQYRGARRLWSIDWSGAGVHVTSKPDIPYTGDNPPTEAQRREGRDPVATLLAMGAHVTATGQCDSRYRVFDGLYVYDFAMRAKGEGRYRHHGIDLPVLRCSLTQKRVAGYTARADLEKTLPEAEIWFARLADSPVAVMTRFASRLPLGEATISLTRLERRPAPGVRP